MASALVFVLAPEAQLPADGADWSDLLQAQGLRSGIHLRIFSVAPEQQDSLDVLISRGADVNKPGWAPLHYAATSGNLDTLRLLLDNYAYIDAESPNQTTPLMMAAKYGNPQAVQLLLEAGADISVKNALGLTAFDFAHQAFS